MSNTTKSSFTWSRVDVLAPGAVLAEWPEFGPISAPLEPLGGGVALVRFESGAVRKFCLDAEVRVS